MNIKAFFSDTKKVSKFCTVIIFIATIRTISEPFRLQYYAKTPLTFDDIKPFLVGALVATTGVFAMTILYYYGKYKIIIVACILTIIGMLIIKKIYLLP